MWEQRGLSVLQVRLPGRSGDKKAKGMLGVSWLHRRWEKCHGVFSEWE